MNVEDTISLYRLFQETPSPHANFLTQTCPENIFLNDCMLNCEPVGMKSTLYEYQRNTVWKMIYRELKPRKRSDPACILLQDLNGRDFWIEKSSMTFFRNLHATYDDVRGGILCENMGNGKTCICLAVILWTKCQRAKCPDLRQPNFDIPSTSHTIGRLASLQDLCIQSLLQQNSPFDSRRYLIPPIANIAMRNAKISYKTNEEIDVEESHGAEFRSRSNNNSPTYDVLLSSTTLVVVPTNLIGQWQFEIMKHVDSNHLRYLVVDESKNSAKLPLAEEIVTYDLLLMSSTRLSAEYGKNGFTNRTLPCQCPYKGKTRQIDCKCPDFTNEVSPLLKVHFLRIIVDEGHSLRKERTQLAMFASELRAERRWICTGTPTSNLVADTEGASYNADDKDLKHLGIVISKFLKCPPFSSCIPDLSFSKLIRQPYKIKEYGAVLRLRQLLSDIMIRNSQKIVDACTKLPTLHERVVYLEPNKFERLSYNVLNCFFMANVILTERTQQDYLFHKSNRKYLLESINNLYRSTFWFCAFEMENLIELRRNAEKSLERGPVIEWLPGDREKLESIVKIINEALGDRIWRMMCDIKEPVYFIENVQSEVQEMWSSVSTHNLRLSADWFVQDDYCLMTALDIDLILYFIHAVLARSKGISLVKSRPSKKLKESNDDSNEQLKKELGDLYQRMRSNAPNFNESEGTASSAISVPSQAKKTKKCQVKSSSTPSQNQTENINNADSSLPSPTPTLSSSIRSAGLDDSPAIPTSIATPSTIDNSITAPQTPSPSPTSSHPIVVPVSYSYDQRKQFIESVSKLKDDSHMVLLQKLKPINIISSSSTKLNYLMNQLIEFSPKEKCLVFCTNPSEIIAIANACEYAQIKYLLYTKVSQTAAERSSVVMQFKTAVNDFRVLIVDLKEFAYGVDLSVASRVYFIEPVWETALERQAIKRAHRIGQIREVHVEVLVLKGTFEEEMIERRTELRRNGASADDQKNVIDDSKMRELFESSKFIPMSSAGESLTSSPTVHEYYRLDKFKRVLPIMKERDMKIFFGGKPSTSRDEDDSIAVDVDNTAAQPRSHGNVNAATYSQPNDISLKSASSETLPGDVNSPDMPVISLTVNRDMMDSGSVDEIDILSDDRLEDEVNIEVEFSNRGPGSFNSISECKKIIGEKHLLGVEFEFAKSEQTTII
ncbi:SNF2 family N-terminal domain-containing protein [Paraphysoderma sedebokerense]|nr:SNF2 family N-terminal domain-containing protein [Paraphysoderma sedebokerense]